MSAPRPKKLNNATCIYCRVALVQGQRTEEHVIARRLVPKGSLERSWNLHAWACKACNNEKGDLEDDIGAISMQPDIFGRLPRPEIGVEQDAQRKARGSFSRATGQRVALSAIQDRIETVPIPGLRVSFGVRGPAHIPEERAFQLAWFQLAAFFYLMTYRTEERRGGVWLGVYGPVVHAMRTDWGRPVMRAFMANVRSWTPNLAVVSARGFFKASMRKHPTAACWSWALEWNENCRVVGFLGDAVAAEAAMEDIVRGGGREVISRVGDHGVRLEVPLAAEDDALFERPETEHGD